MNGQELSKVLTNKRILSVEFRGLWAGEDRCETVELLTDGGDIVYISYGQIMGEAFLWFTEEASELDEE